MSDVIDTSGTPQQVASWIWDRLVPESGQASTVQGELLRAVEKLRWEAQENGNINWDDGFLRLLTYLETTLLAFDEFSDADRARIAVDIARLREFTPPDEESDEDAWPHIDDDLYDRLVGDVVAFARGNPTPIFRTPDPDLHR